MIHIILRASFIEDYIGFSINAMWGNLRYCKYAQFSLVIINLNLPITINWNTKMDDEDLF
jgi:hypothetical protein